MRVASTSVFFVLLSITQVDAQFFTENFDGLNTTNTVDIQSPCNDGDNDYFGIVCLSNGTCTNSISSAVDLTPHVNTMTQGQFFGAQDVNRSGSDCNNITGTLTIEDINIVGKDKLVICLDVAEDNAQDDDEDWDANSSVTFNTSIDGSAFVTNLSIGALGTNTEPMVSCGSSQIALRDRFDTFCFSIESTGSSLNFQIVVDNLNAGDEDIAVDNIRVYSDVADDLANLPMLSSACFEPCTNPATAEAGPNQTICEIIADGSTPEVTLAGSFGGGASSASWSGGAGTFDPNATTLNAKYTPTETELNSGSVELTLTTNDPDGFCIAALDIVTISFDQSAEVDAGENQSVCEANADGSVHEITLAGSIGGSATSATWSGGAGTYDPNANSLTAKYTPTAGEISAGSVTLTLTTDDPTGLCDEASDMLSITFISTPTILDASVCEGSSVNMLGSGTPAASDPYLSSNEMVATVSSEGVVSGIAAGTSTITYTAENGCQVTGVITVNTTPNPGSTATIGVCASTINLNDPIPGTTITTRESGGTWSIVSNPNNDAVIMSDEVTLTTTMTSPYQFRYSIEGENGCVDSELLSINVFANPEIQFILCEPTCVGVSDGVIKPHSLSTPAPASYQWFESDGTTLLSDKQDLENVAAGSYILKLTDNNGCTLEELVSLTDPIAPSITFNSTTTRVCAGSNSAAFTYNATTGNPTQINIDFNAAAEAEGFQDQSMAILSATPISLTVPTGAASGSYTASVVVENANDCMSAAQNITIEVLANPTASPVAASLCLGSEVNIDGNPTLENITSHSWEIMDAGGTGATDMSSLMKNDEQIVTFISNGLTGGTVVLKYSIVDENGCQGSATVNVVVHSDPTITGVMTSCSEDLNTYTISYTATGTVTSSAGMVDGTMNEVNGVPVDQSVVLTVTDANMCTASIMVTAPDCSCPSVSPPTNPQNKEVCVGSMNSALAVTVPTGHSVNWYSDANAQNLITTNSGSYTPSVSAVGTYAYYAQTVNDITGCKSGMVQAVSFEIHDLPMAVLTPVTPLCDDLNSGSISITNSNFPMPAQYAWSNNSTNQDLTNVAAGTYMLTITDANGCMNTVTTTIESPECNFDLAIRKEIVTASPYQIGQTVAFDITVFNQGLVAAHNILVQDYLPSGLMFNIADNEDAPNDWSNTLQHTIQTIGAGGETTIRIQLTVEDEVQGAMIVNSAEILSATNGAGQTLEDEDSPYSEVQPSIDDETDNDINDNGIAQEGSEDNSGDQDDFDFAKLNICPAITAVLNGSTELCEPDNVTVSISIDGGVAPYTIMYTDGSFMMTTNSTSLEFDISQSISYSLVQVFDANSCPASVSGEASIVVNETPEEPNVQDVSICEGDEVSILPDSDCKTEPTTIYSETFDEEEVGVSGPDGTLVNPSNSQWMLSGDYTGLDNDDDFFKVVDGELVAQDLAGEICFTTSIIDISAQSNVSYSMELAELGTWEASDYVIVSQILDGVKTEIVNLSDDWSNASIMEQVEGDALQIEICVKNSAGSEKFILDNILVTCEPTCAFNYYASFVDGAPTGLLFGPSAEAFNPSNEQLGSGATFYVTQLNPITGCESEAQAVNVSVSEIKTAGTSTTITVCNENPSEFDFNLFDKLGGSPSSSGLWEEMDEQKSAAFSIEGGHLGTVDLQGVTPGTYMFEYSVVGEEPCSNSAASVTVNVNACFDMALMKVLSTTGEINPGDEVEFDITVYNQGDVPAFDVFVLDSPPEELEYSGFEYKPNTEGSFAPIVDEIESNLIEITAIPAGASVTFTVKMNVADDAEGMVVNNAEIFSASSTDGGISAFDMDSQVNSGNSAMPVDNDILDDSGNDDFDFAALEIVLSCAISNVEVDAICTAGTDKYCLEISFDANNTISSSYEVVVDGLVKGPYPYSTGTVVNSITICDDSWIGDEEMDKEVVVSDADSGGPKDGEPELLITSVIPDPATGGCDGEMITILNNSCVDIDLTGYYITDASSTRHIFGAIILAANTSISLSSNDLNDTNCGSGVWNNGGDTATLLDADDNVISTLTWSSNPGDDVPVENTYVPSSCMQTGEICVATFLYDEPSCLYQSLIVTKTDANPNDLDDIPDSQTITLGEDAVFEISFTNNGNEPLCDIFIVDNLVTQANALLSIADCSPMYSLLDANDTLSVGETITYKCNVEINDANVILNRVEINARGCESEVAITSMDETDITVLMPPAICSFDEDVEINTTCNANGTYNLQITFTHIPTITPHVSIEVDGNIVAVNVDSDGSIPVVYTIDNYGVGDGSENHSVFIQEQFISPFEGPIISEFHYDNVGADMEEGVEIYGAASTDLTGYQILLYNGSTGLVYQTVDLTGFIPNEGGGFGAIYFLIPGMQNGNDGIALINPSGAVLQFISYEGSFAATNGAAIGQIAMDVGDLVVEPLTGSGSIIYNGMDWALNPIPSFGQANQIDPMNDILTNCEIPPVAFTAPVCDVVCGTLACNNDLQISLGLSCEQHITPDMVLEGDYEFYEIYTVTIMEEDGTVIGDTVTSEHIGQELTIKVSCGENSCWGTLRVEDKITPYILNCAELTTALTGSGTYTCADLDDMWNLKLDSIPTAEVQSCSGNYDLRIENNLTGEMCGQGYIWQTRYLLDYTTAHGDKETTVACEVNVPIMPISPDDVYYPADQILACDRSGTPEDILNYYRQDTTEAVGIINAYPYLINSYGDTIMLNGDHCNILTTYWDRLLEVCGTNRKIIRTWTSLDWCTSEIDHYDQIIKLIIDKPIRCVAPDDFEVYIGTHCMLDSIIVPKLDSIFLGCSDLKSVTLGYHTGSGSSAVPNLLSYVYDDIILNADSSFTVPPIEAPYGVIWFEYLIEDVCGNKSSCYTSAAVLDNLPPTPVCNPDVVVSLDRLERGTDGLSKVYASAFDAGSHDNSCRPVYIKILRMDELNNSDDGYWNGNGNSPDYGQAPKPNFFGACDGANGDDFGDISLDNGSIVRTGSQIWFDDYTKLCCTDDEVMVVMRVFDVYPGPGPVDPRRMHSSPSVIAGTSDTIQNDLYGRFNQCMVPLLVQDKTQIQGACKPLALYCDQYPDDAMANAPQVNMLCSNQSYTLSYVDSVQIGDCGNGLVSRKWYADMSNGDKKHVCTQPLVISSRPFDPYTIKWPKSYTGEVFSGIRKYQDGNGACIEEAYEVPMGDAVTCTNDAFACEPYWDETACSLIGISYQNDTLYVDGDACLKIIRTWNVIDWCLYVENRDIDDINDNDTFEAIKDDCISTCDSDNVYFRLKDVDIDGYYRYEQLVKIIDDQLPQFVEECEGGIGDITDGCTTKIITGKTATDNDGCGQEFLKWIAIVKDTLGNTISSYPGVTKNTGTFNIETSELAKGIYNITWIVEDACGNSNTCTEQWILEDTKAPVPICIEGVTSTLMETTGSITIWASDFDLKSEDNCTAEPIFSFSGDSIQLSTTITCADMGDFIEKTFTYKVWVWDEAENRDYCFASFRVTDNEVCGGTMPDGSSVIQGEIRTEDGDMLQDAEVSLMTIHPNYPYSMMTEQEGYYAFMDNPRAYDYEITPHKDGDDINGVSTLDLVLIQKHVLGLKQLDSPYKVLAADANGDQRLSAIDLVEIRKLILGITTEFNNSDSWKFVTANQEFNSTYNPWPFTDIIEIYGLSHDMMNEDFIAIKVGDVNNNAVANNLLESEIRSAGSIRLNISDKMVQGGEQVVVEFSSLDFEDVAGFQMTLEHEGLKLINVIGDAVEISEDNIARHGVWTTMSWHPTETLSAEQLFEMRFEATENLYLSDVLSINSRITSTEAYVGDAYMTYDLELAFDQEVKEELKGEFELFQNEPNPFFDKTVVSFTLPEQGMASLKFINAAGQLLHEITGEYASGYNEVVISKDNLATSGVIYYRLESQNNILTKKMIVIE